MLSYSVPQHKPKRLKSDQSMKTPACTSMYNAKFESHLGTSSGSLSMYNQSTAVAAAVLDIPELCAAIFQFLTPRELLFAAMRVNRRWHAVGWRFCHALEVHIGTTQDLTAVVHNSIIPAAALRQVSILYASALLEPSFLFPLLSMIVPRLHSLTITDCTDLPLEQLRLVLLHNNNNNNNSSSTPHLKKLTLLRLPHDYMTHNSSNNATTLQIPSSVQQLEMSWQRKSSSSFQPASSMTTTEAAATWHIRFPPALTHLTLEWCCAPRHLVARDGGFQQCHCCSFESASSLQSLSSTAASCDLPLLLNVSLSQLTQLEHLQLDSLEARDMNQLSRLRKLKSVKISRCYPDGLIENGVLTRLAHLSEIDLIGLKDIDVVAVSQQLVPVGALRTLSIRSRRFSLSSLPFICTLTGLTNLELCGSYHFGDDDLVHLTALRRLVCLVLGNARLCGDGLCYLSGLAELRELHLGNAHCGTLTTLRPLSLFTGLTELSLNGQSSLNGSSDEERLQHVSALSGLTSLFLSDCNWLEDGDLIHISQLTRLEQLDLSECDQLTCGGITSHLTALRRLQQVRPSEFALALRGIIPYL